MTRDDVKARLLLLLAQSKKKQASLHRFKDFCLRRYSIRGRSHSCPDQVRSNLQRSLDDQVIRQWRVK